MFNYVGNNWKGCKFYLMGDGCEMDRGGFVNNELVLESYSLMYVWFWEILERVVRWVSGEKGVVGFARLYLVLVGLGGKA